jgi:N-acetylglucosaminyldiphosphoundecaprenol N-acetyl-beta-D-mannosaminyltransferase
MTTRITILGVPVDCVDMEAALIAVDNMVGAGKQNAIISVNPEMVIMATRDDYFLSLLKNASLLIPDGIGVVWAARLLGQAKIERVPGSELMPAICKRSVEKGYKIFLFGAQCSVVERAVDKLKEAYAGIAIVGYQNGYVPQEQMDSLVDQINRSGANILFVALGIPKQELWMERFLERVPNVRVCMGVGGTFDVISGTVKRAPRLLIKCHCEWLYRLMTRPSRLLRQAALPIFAFKVLIAWWGK